MENKSDAAGVGLREPLSTQVQCVQIKSWYLQLKLSTSNGGLCGCPQGRSFMEAGLEVVQSRWVCRRCWQLVPILDSAGKEGLFVHFCFGVDLPQCVCTSGSVVTFVDDTVGLRYENHAIDELLHDQQAMVLVIITF